MIFQGKNVFNASFDAYADDYHTVRPGYPAQLFKDIQEQCGINRSSRLLEIGTGSGIATIELAKFSGEVVAIEPGANLAKIARKQTENLNNVKVVEVMFENFQFKEKFDSILAFTAFHWVSEATKYQKVVALLKDSGSLVLIWNSFFQSDSPVTVEVNKAYRKFLPGVYGEESQIAEVNRGVLAKLNRREQEIGQSSLFYTVFLQKYLTNCQYNEQTYPKLLNTFPKVVEIEDAKRKAFLSHVSSVVRHFGTISVPVLTTLIVCKKRSSFLETVGES